MPQFNSGFWLCKTLSECRSKEWQFKFVSLKEIVPYINIHILLLKNNVMWQNVVDNFNDIAPAGPGLESEAHKHLLEHNKYIIFDPPGAEYRCE